MAVYRAWCAWGAHSVVVVAAAAAVVGTHASILDHAAAVPLVEPVDVAEAVAAVDAAPNDCSVETSRWTWVATIVVASRGEALKLEVATEPWS
jgi:hypothetical protein